MLPQKRWAGINVHGRVEERRNAGTPHQFVITVLRSLASWTTIDLLFSLFFHSTPTLVTMPPQPVHVQLLPRFRDYSRHPMTPREKWIQVLNQFVLQEVIKARDDAEEKEGFIASKALVAAAELWCHYHSSRYLVERVVCNDFSFCEYRDCYLVPENMPVFKRILRLTPESFEFVRKMIEVHPVFEHKASLRSRYSLRSPSCVSATMVPSQVLMQSLV